MFRIFETKKKEVNKIQQTTGAKVAAPGGASALASANQPKAIPCATAAGGAPPVSPPNYLAAVNTPNKKPAMVVYHNSVVCTHCQMQGHLIQNCPNKEANKNHQHQGETQTKAFNCFKCGGAGHFARNCNSTEERRLCRCCGQPGHYKKDCPKYKALAQYVRCWLCNCKGHFRRDCPQVCGRVEVVYPITYALEMAVRQKELVGKLSQCPELIEETKLIPLREATEVESSIKEIQAEASRSAIETQKAAGDVRIAEVEFERAKKALEEAREAQRKAMKKHSEVLEKAAKRRHLDTARTEYLTSLVSGVLGQSVKRLRWETPATAMAATPTRHPKSTPTTGSKKMVRSSLSTEGVEEESGSSARKVGKFARTNSPVLLEFDEMDEAAELTTSAAVAAVTPLCAPVVAAPSSVALAEATATQKGDEATQGNAGSPTSAQ